MKHLEMLGLAALAAMAMTSFAAGTASATTLEVGGTAQNKSVELSASLSAESSTFIKTTGGQVELKCSETTMTGSTSSPFTAAKLAGVMTGLTISGCEPSEFWGLPTLVVDKPGTFYLEHRPGTTDATVYSEGLEMRMFFKGNPFYNKCKTVGSAFVFGLLTGAASGHVILHVNAVMNCGMLYPSVKWESRYTITTPTGLGVVE